MRHAAIITLLGYLASSGVPFASFYVTPKVFVADNAATAQNILVHHGLFIAAIFVHRLSSPACAI